MNADTKDGSTQGMVLMRLNVPTAYGQSTRSFAFEPESAMRLAERMTQQAEATQEAAAE